LDIQAEKAQLRQTLLKKRVAMSVEQWQHQSLRLCEHLLASPLLQSATSKRVLIYISTRKEPDLSPLLKLPNLTWGLPRCEGNQLQWHDWSSASPAQLIQGRYGIWEPHADLPQLQPETIDLILVPAVACDHQGYRLGYGGGFYDRCLGQPAWQHIPTVGIVFDFAYVPQLPHADWDVPLQAVCTEQRFITLIN
jgi:5-formyltetrahydrofolate cyclo-ligase